MRSAMLIHSLVVLCLVPGSPSRAGERDGHRPVFQFTPAKNFINDPNGLVFLGGEYHLDEFGLKVRCGDGEETVIGVDRRAATVFLDRAHSCAVGFSPHFAGRHFARLSVGDGSQLVRLHVIVDATSVEVFADGGRVVLTDQIFPQPGSRGVSLFATGGAARLRSLEAWELRP
ncbi:MAG: GH32 C-terminal domain-containing protein [Isosphaerales bacterium]